MRLRSIQPLSYIILCKVTTQSVVVRSGLVSSSVHAESIEALGRAEASVSSVLLQYMVELRSDSKQLPKSAHLKQCVDMLVIDVTALRLRGSMLDEMEWNERTVSILARRVPLSLLFLDLRICLSGVHSVRHLHYLPSSKSSPDHSRHRSSSSCAPSTNLVCAAISTQFYFASAQIFTISLPGQCLRFEVTTFHQASWPTNG